MGVGACLKLASRFDRKLTRAGSRRKGSALNKRQQDEILRFLIAREDIDEVLNLIALQNGADVVVAVKARMAERVSAPALINAISD